MPQLNNRDSHEAALAAALAAVHEQAIQDIRDKLGDPPNEHNLDAAFWTALQAKYRDALKPLLAAVYLDAVAELGDELDKPIDLTSDANQWAANYSDSLARDLVANRKQYTANAVQRGAKEGWTLDQIIAALMLYFSVINAGMIAVTETTNAVSTGTQKYQDKYRVLVGALASVVETAGDDRVCEICAPKDHEPTLLVGWPPFHVGCRCSVVLVGTEVKL